MVMVETSFGQWLRDEIDRQGLAVAEVARRMNPENPEQWRRRLYEYMSGRRGRARKPAVREAIARALGIDESEMP